MSFFKHFVSIFDLVLKLVDQAHVDHGVGVFRILLQRLLAVGKGLIKVFGVVLVDAHAVVGKANVTEVLEGLCAVYFSSLFVVENTLVELLHDEGDTGDELMHGSIFLVFLGSDFEEFHGFSKVRSTTQDVGQLFEGSCHGVLVSLLFFFQ